MLFVKVYPNGNVRVMDCAYDRNRVYTDWHAFLFTFKHDLHRYTTIRVMA